MALVALWSMADGFEYSQEQIAEREASLRDLRIYARESHLQPSEAAIEKLGAGLRRYTYGASFPPLRDQIVEVRNELRQTLLSMPGHADYFAKRLREADARLTGAKTNSERGHFRHLLTTEQQYCFQTPGLLPSAESVRVLGKYLFDEKGMVRKVVANDPRGWQSRQYDAGFSPNSSYALRAIAKLPIVSPPVPTRKHSAVIYDEDIDPWRVWYQQVKAGKRTFRFEGDPLEYSLAGPVVKAADPAVVRPNPGLSDPTAEGHPSEEKPFPLVPLVSAGFLFVLALWLAAKGKRRTS